MRCRHLNDNLIKVIVLEKERPSKGYEGDAYLVNDCPIYNNLVKDILIEKQAPLKQSLIFFFNKAGYHTSMKQETMRTGLEQYFTDLYAKCKLSYTYETIPNINSTEILEAQQRILNSEATLEDKISMNKFFF